MIRRAIFTGANDTGRRWSLPGRSLFALAVGIIVLFAPPFSRAELGGAKAPRVKAVFLYNFTQFVEWPAAAFPSAEAPFVIGILGPDLSGGFWKRWCAMRPWAGGI